MKVEMQKYTEICIIKTSVSKFQAYLKTIKNKTETLREKQKKIQEANQKKTKNETKEIKNVIIKKNIDWLETNENKRNSLVKKVDQGRREENQNKIQKEKLKKIKSKKRKNNNKI